ncbi:hypothetical protein CEXT_377381 [Caerostris extrusa]|uniref:Uncharacterized protein n=1 Tax=Caerostris extrusa TaxID=172846 RepID=A0AAV4QE17_CAEEX|nr:hypothetical protein CEXT_377381 [Caerostris extrusa]
MVTSSGCLYQNPVPERKEPIASNPSPKFESLIAISVCHGKAIQSHTGTLIRAPYTRSVTKICNPSSRLDSLSWWLKRNFLLQGLSCNVRIAVSMGGTQPWLEQLRDFVTFEGGEVDGWLWGKRLDFLETRSVQCRFFPRI